MKIEIQSQPQPQPQELIFKVDRLEDYLNSKYLGKMNTENMRIELLSDIENWYRSNFDFSNDNIINQMENTKLSYYTILINTSGLDEKTQKDMISKYITNKINI